MRRDPYSPDELLPIGEAARVLGVSIDTVRRWNSQGKLTSVRTLGNQRRFRRGELDSLMSTEQSA